MALKLSTGLRNALAGDVAARTDAGSQIAFVNATSRITDTTSSLLTDGFRAGDIITVASSTSNDGTYNVTAVASDGSYMTVSESLVEELAASASPTITARGKNFKELFKYSVLRVYSGSAPADANAAETGTLLLEVTSSSGAFTAGTSTNGLEFGDVTTGVLAKSSSQTWSDAGIATGTAGYWRLFDNGAITGSSSTSIRMQGTCGTSGADLNMSSTSVATGATTTIDSFSVTVPAS